MSEQTRSEPQFTELPEGTVTFLFTDIEGSTMLLQRLRDLYATLLADQRRILREVFAKYQGQEVDTQGDAFFVAFPRATQAVSAAVEIQHELAKHQWPESAEVRVRMGLHTGEPLKAEEGYVGMDVHRAARIALVGHGGQVLLSETTIALVMDELPEGVELLDLGRHLLKDMRRPEHIRQLVMEGLPSEFPPLTSLGILQPEISLDMGVVKLPDFLEEGAEEAPLPVFVEREQELERLDEFLYKALAGKGQVAFITGGPGRGKTALMEEFIRRAMEADPDLLAVNGSGNAYTGAGDPYLLFREALGMLTGDVEAIWTAGTISQEHARRLWNTCPLTAQTLVDYGPDLMEVFVSVQRLLSRISIGVPEQRGLLQALRTFVDRGGSTTGDLEQKALFEQYTRVLCQIAERHPLLLMLDDLQWADAASINLLFHLGRRLVGNRILVVGAYRTEEIALGRGEGRHPLESVLNEFKRSYGNVWIDLSQASEEEDRQFVEAYLDSVPNRLGDAFREALYARTEGHPLFTIELLREMQARGDLLIDNNGFWIEGPELDWRVLPARVEGVIEERIGRLEDELKEILSIASVAGEEFTAQVVARVQQVSERQLLVKLSQELEKRHRLVLTQGETKIGEQVFSRHKFAHILFQQFLYNALSQGERRLLHYDVAKALEEFNAGEIEAIAVQLAHHYDQAEQTDQAIYYLLIAGDQARMSYAHQEAIEHYQRGLQLLIDKGDKEQAAQTLLKLGLVYTADFRPDEARKAYQKAFRIWEPLRISPDLPYIETLTATMYIAIAEPPTLDTGMIGDDVSAFIAAQLFEGLVEISPDYNVLPATAARWDVSKGGREYVFRIQAGLKWSDGSPLSAGDFERAWIRNLSFGSQSPVTDLLYVIKNARKFANNELDDLDEVGIMALDDLTLQVSLESPTAYFPYLLAHPVSFPLHRWNVEEGGQIWLEPGNLVSNGPYHLVEWEPGEKLVLRRNRFYRGYFHGNLQTIECPFIIDFESAFKAYDSDTLDAISMISSDPNTVERAQVRYPKELIFTPQPSTCYLTFLADRPPFNNVLVRRAFGHAVDRDALVREATHGLFLPAKGGFLPPGMPGHSNAIGLPFNPEEGRRLLAEAGYQGGIGFPQVNLISSGGSREAQIVSFLQRSWREQLRIQVESIYVSWREFLERREHDPSHLSLSGWLADYQDPDSMLRIIFHSVEGINPPRWHNKFFDALVEEAARVTDQNVRLDLYREAEQILVVEEAVIMPLGYVQGRHLVKPWVAMPRVPPFLQRLKEVVIRREV